MSLDISNQEELCEIYNNLNSWKWDERLGDKPKDFDSLPNYNHKWYHIFFRRKTKSAYTKPYFTVITKMVPEKELLRYHHMHNLNSTNEEFERWWIKTRLFYSNLRQMK